MDLGSSAILAVLIFVAALLYSSVGHAGASGYIAAMALFGLAPEVMKPTALVLNILVATIATIRFYRAGYFDWATFWPFALGSIPLSFIGGAAHVPGHWYKTIVGLVLLLGAARLLAPGALQTEDRVHRAPLLVAIFWGAVIGLLSGLTGTGGGIFLSPLLLFAGWAKTRTTGGISSAFILANSIAGLAGRLLHFPTLPSALPFWAAAALLGGLLGAHFGTRKLPLLAFRRVLGVVLVVAGLKLIFT